MAATMLLRTIASAALCGILLQTGASAAAVPQEEGSTLSARQVDLDMNDPCFPFTCDSNATCVEKKCQCNEGFVPDFSGMKCYATPAQSFPACPAASCSVKMDGNSFFQTGPIAFVDKQVYCCPEGSDGYVVNGEHRCSTSCANKPTATTSNGAAEITQPATSVTSVNPTATPTAAA